MRMRCTQQQHEPAGSGSRTPGVSPEVPHLKLHPLCKMAANGTLKAGKFPRSGKRKRSGAVEPLSPLIDVSEPSETRITNPDEILDQLGGEASSQGGPTAVPSSEIPNPTAPPVKFAQPLDENTASRIWRGKSALVYPQALHLVREWPLLLAVCGSSLFAIDLFTKSPKLELLGAAPRKPKDPRAGSDWRRFPTQVPPNYLENDARIWICVSSLPKASLIAALNNRSCVHFYVPNRSDLLGPQFHLAASVDCTTHTTSLLLSPFSTPTETLLAVGSAGAVSVWKLSISADSVTHTPIKILSLSSPLTLVSCIEWNSRSSLFIGTSDGELILATFAEGPTSLQIQQRVPLGSAPLSCLALSPDASFLLAAASSTVHILRVSDSATPIQFVPPDLAAPSQRIVTGVVWLSARVFASCAEDGTVRLWRVEEEKCCFLESLVTPSASSPYPIFGLAFSPNLMLMYYARFFTSREPLTEIIRLPVPLHVSSLSPPLALPPSAGSLWDAAQAPTSLQFQQLQQMCSSSPHFSYDPTATPTLPVPPFSELTPLRLHAFLTTSPPHPVVYLSFSEAILSAAAALPTLNQLESLSLSLWARWVDAATPVMPPALVELAHATIARISTSFPTSPEQPTLLSDALRELCPICNAAVPFSCPPATSFSSLLLPLEAICVLGHRLTRCPRTLLLITHLPCLRCRHCKLSSRALDTEGQLFSLVEQLSPTCLLCCLPFIWHIS